MNDRVDKVVVSTEYIQVRGDKFSRLGIVKLGS